MGSKVADLPDHLAKVLAELEARKESLRSRMESLDTAISGIHGMQATAPGASLARQPDNSQDVVAEHHELDETAPVQAVPLREEVGEVIPVPNTPSQPNPSERRDFILKYDTPNTPAERPNALKRPLEGAAVELRQPTHLNVYVNKNTEWASRQFVPPHSPRAVFRRKTGHRCPKCGSQDTRLSLSRGIADCFMFLFDYSLARCRNCDNRFRIWRSRDEDDDQPEADIHHSAD